MNLLSQWGYMHYTWTGGRGGMIECLIVNQTNYLHSKPEIFTPQKIPGINKVIIVFSSLALGHLKHWPMICLCLSFHECSQTDRRWHVVLWWYCCCSQMSSCQGCHFFFPAFFGFQSILLRDLGRTSQLRHTPYLHSEETLLPLQLNRLRSAGLRTSARIRTSCSWHSEWNCQGVGRCFPFNPSDSQGNHLSTKEILDHSLIYMVREMVSSSSDAHLCCAHWDNQK